MYKNTHHYAVEKFYLAVKTLATANNPIQGRVREAWTSHLHRLNDQHLPDAIKDEFKSLLAEVTALTDRSGDGSIAVTTAAMPDPAASEHARRLFSVFCKLVDYP